MRWLKRDLWKVGIAIAGMLLLLVIMVWAPVSAVGAYEGTSRLAGPGMGTVQATPTEDATMTALNKEKLAQEVQQLKNQNEPDPFAWLKTNASIFLSTFLSTLAVVIGGLLGLWRWRVDRKEAQDKELEARNKELDDQNAARNKELKDHQAERERRDDDRLQKTIAGLGSEKDEARAIAASMLLTFLQQPGYERFHKQIFNLAVTNLRLRHVDPSTPARPDPLGQALITVFKESFPLARKALIGRVKPPYHYNELERLDASLIHLEYAFLRYADLEGIWMRDAYLRGANLRGAKLSNAALTHTDLRDAYLHYVHLSGARLRKANLSGAHLKGAHLDGAYLESANLSEAHLDGADLSGAYLVSANLNGAHLDGACLASAHLDGADLRDTDLRGVKMNNETDLSGAKLQGAKYNTKEIREKDEKDEQWKLVTIEPTQWPQKNFKPSDTIWGLICVDC